MIESHWTGCYRASWNAAPLHPEAFAHPAKGAFGLAERVYRHCLDQGYFEPGQLILDPFAGIAGFSFHASRHGLRYFGVELEPRFQVLAEKNIALWRERYVAAFPQWGQAQVVQGDSRRLLDVIREAGGLVASPPFQGVVPSQESAEWHQARDSIGKNNSLGRDGYGSSPGQLANMPEGVVSSPPFAQQQTGGGLAKPEARHNDGHKFGNSHGYQQNSHSPGQLANMPEGVVSSPPYAAGAKHTGGLDTAPGHIEGGPLRYVDYGNTPGQLGAMGEGNGIVSSPPWATTHASEQNEDFYRGRGKTGKLTGTVGQQYAESRVEIYNPYPYMSEEWLEHRKETAKKQNIGRLPEEAIDPEYPTFWGESKKIVAQCYAALKPGSYAVWVCGDYVRDKARVPFSARWLALCQAAGFTPVEWVYAWKLDPGPTQMDIFGNDHDMTRQQVSFFRRLANERAKAEGRHDAVVLNEDVLVMRKATP